MSKRVLRDIVCIVTGLVIVGMIIYTDVIRKEKNESDTITIKEEYESLNKKDGMLEVNIKEDVFDQISNDYLSKAIEEDKNVILIADCTDNKSRALMNVVSSLISNYGIATIDYLNYQDLSEEEKANLPKLLSYDKAPILLFIKDKKIANGIVNEKEELNKEEETNLYSTMEGYYIDAFDIACDEDC